MTENDTPRELTPDEMRAEPHSDTSRENLESNEMTSWDGTGNPIKQVIVDDESGHLSEGTGQSSDEAMKEARDSDAVVGENVGLKPHE